MGTILIRGKKRKITDGTIDLIIPEFNIIITGTKIGTGTAFWSNVNIYGAEIGRECKIGSFVEIKEGVKIGNKVKIEPFVFIPDGVVIEDGVFIGPNVTFTNDRYPRSIHPDGKLISSFEKRPTLVRKEASIGAGSTILCGVTIGKGSMIGIGSAVTEDVPEGGILYGQKAMLRRFVEEHGN